MAKHGGWVIDLDLWFEQEVKPRMRGRVFMVRFADDAVLGFEREDVARKWLSRRSRAAQ